MHIHNHGNITGNVGFGNTSGSIISGGDAEALKDILAELRKFEGELAKLSGLADLAERFKTVEAELAKPAPSQWRVAGIMTDVRNALSGASGNLLATGALGLVRQFLGE